MAFEKVGFNITAIEDFTVPTYADFNISNSSTELINSIPEKAQAATTVNGFSYLGVGIMLTLFFYLIWKLGDALELREQPYSTIRSVGISAGVVGILGTQMLALGFFVEFYPVAMFLSIMLVATLWVFIEDKR